MIIHAKLILFIVCVVELIIKFTLFLKSKDYVYFKVNPIIFIKKVSDVEEKLCLLFKKYFFSIQVLIILLLIFIFYIFIIHLNKSVYEYFFQFMELLKPRF